MIISKLDNQHLSSPGKTLSTESPKNSHCNRKINLGHPASEVVRIGSAAASPLLSPPIIGDSRNYKKSYDRIRDIGTGSFGKAVLVQEKSSGKYCVMKIIETSLLGPKERHDTMNEIRVLSSLKHPYIISYKESFIQDDGVLCIVMDYADGGDLYKTIATQKKKVGKGFSEAQIIRWFTQATLALKYLHDKHILHRDLKSQNLFLMSNGRLRLGDFGIAKVLDGTTAFTKTQIGTPYYLSPEICKNQPYSWASDIWSLGCILYQLATLHVPFNAPNISVLIEKITRHQPPPLPDEYTVGLRRLYNECMQREWQKRPSATAILFKDIIQDEIKKMLLEEQEKRRLTDGGSSLLPSPSSSQESIITVTSSMSTDVDINRNEAGKVATVMKQSPLEQNCKYNQGFLTNEGDQRQQPPFKIDDDSDLANNTGQWNDGEEKKSNKNVETPEKNRTVKGNSLQLRSGGMNKNGVIDKRRFRLHPPVNENGNPSSHRHLEPPSVSSSRSSSSYWAQCSESNSHTVNKSINATSSTEASHKSNILGDCGSSNQINCVRKKYDDWKKTEQKTDNISTVNKKNIGQTGQTTDNQLDQLTSKRGRRGSLYGVTSNFRTNIITQRFQKKNHDERLNDDAAKKQNSVDFDSDHRNGTNQLRTLRGSKCFSVEHQKPKSASPVPTGQISFNWIKRFQKKKVDT